MAKQTKVVKAPAGAPQPKIIINKITTRPVQRTEQDIPKWRQAIQSAEAHTPRRILLYTLYHDVVLDGHVIAVTDKRKDTDTNANWQFVDANAKPVDIINDIIDSNGFDDVVREIMQSKFWGYSILEPKFWLNHDNKWEVAANLIPRLHYRPEKGIVTYQVHGEEGVNVREGIYQRTIMEVGNPKDLGLLISAAQYAILKRGGVGDWAMFVQVFGRPIVDATWDGFDEAQRIKLQESLDIGPGGVIVRPEGTNVNLLNGANGQSNVHGDFYKAMNKEISKALLGTTETTESSDSSGHAQSKIHDEQDDKKHESDLNFVRKILNSRFTRILKAHGIDTKGGRFIIQGEEVQLDKKEMFEIHKSLVVDVKLPVAHDFFYEEYGMPKPDNYDEMVAQQHALNSKEPNSKEPNLKKTKPKTDDRRQETDEDIELTFWQKLTRLFLAAPAETTGATTGHLHTLNLQLSNDFKDAEFIERVWQAQGKLQFDFELYQYTISNLLNGLEKGFKSNEVKLSFAPGFNYDVDDPGLLASLEVNLFKFSGAKTFAELEALNKLFRTSKNFNEFYSEALKILGTYNGEWLLTEYNTAILQGFASNNYNRLLDQVDIFPYWEYKTAGDELVRHSHQLLEGIMLPATDPRWRKLYPPNGWNCRCYVAPRLASEYDESKAKKWEARADAYLDSPAFERERKQGWGINKAAAGMVFGEDQQYAHHLPGYANKLLNSLSPKDFKLPPAEELTQAANTTTPPPPASLASWLLALEVVNKQKVLRDFKNRPITVPSSVTATAGNDNKGELIAALTDAVLKPDEVWLSGLELNQMVYIKYYKGETLVAFANVTSKEVSISNWLTVNSAEALKQYRSGVLMHSK